MGIRRECQRRTHTCPCDVGESALREGFPPHATANPIAVRRGVSHRVTTSENQTGLGSLVSSKTENLPNFLYCKKQRSLSQPIRQKTKSLRVVIICDRPPLIWCNHPICLVIQSLATTQGSYNCGWVAHLRAIVFLNEI